MASRQACCRTILSASPYEADREIHAMFRTAQKRLGWNAAAREGDHGPVNALARHQVSLAQGPRRLRPMPRQARGWRPPRPRVPAQHQQLQAPGASWGDQLRLTIVGRPAVLSAPGHIHCQRAQITQGPSTAFPCLGASKSRHRELSSRRAPGLSVKLAVSRKLNSYRYPDAVEP
jgi:hypothetical protein